MKTETITSELAEVMPLSMMELEIGKAGKTVGLVIIDEINGFATVGAGALAPAAPNDQVSMMVSETNRLAAAFTRGNKPILVFWIHIRLVNLNFPTHSIVRKEQGRRNLCRSSNGWSRIEIRR